METLLINYKREKPCSTESPLIEPLIGAGSSTSVNLKDNKQSSSSVNHNQHQPNPLNNLRLLRSASFSSVTDDVAIVDGQCVRSAINGKPVNNFSLSSSSSTTTTTHNTTNGYSVVRGCYSATSTPVKSIANGFLPSSLRSSSPPSTLTISNGLLTCRPSSAAAVTTITSPTGSVTPTMSTPTPTSALDELTRALSGCLSSSSSTVDRVNGSTTTNSSVYSIDDDTSGPKSLPAYSSSSRYSTGSCYSDGLLSSNGSINWDSESDWIMLFDEMLKLKGTNKQGSEDCICRRKYSDSVRSKASQGVLSSYNDFDNMNGLKTSPLKRAASLPPSRRGISPNIRMASAVAHSPGAADEEMFIKAFEDVPLIHISSLKELEEELRQIKESLAEKNTDWTKRIEGLKRLRSIMMTGATEAKEFLDWFKLLEMSFLPCVKDLRSQVVRETCFTIAYISQKLGLKATRFCEMLLPILIGLIPNSAKIMSSSATVAVRFIIQYTRSPRLIPIITYNMTSKSKEIRKACCEFLDQMLHTWPTGSLEKHVTSLQEAIKKGISDADPEARQFARKAFWGFADHFKDQADSLLQSLDPSKQRILHGEALQQGLTSPSSSSSSSASTFHPTPVYRSNSSSSGGSLSQTDGSRSIQLLSSPLSSSHHQSSLISPSSSSVSSSTSSASSRKMTTNSNLSNKNTTNSSSNSLENVNRCTNNHSSVSYVPRIRSNLNKYSTLTSPSSLSSSPSGIYLNGGSTLRSTSAIDTDAARRARSRATISTFSSKYNNNLSTNGHSDNLGRKKVTSPSVNCSINGTKDSGRSSSASSSSEARSRYRNRVSQSQPNSRSASPLSRGFNGSTVTGTSVAKSCEPDRLSSSNRIRRNSGIPVSTSSREASPSRCLSNGSSSLNGSKLPNGLSDNNNKPFNGFTRSFSGRNFTLPEKLVQKNCENELNNGLKSLNNVPRNRYNHEDHSDAESDTSSVCSDFSFAARNIEEVSDIIRNLSSLQWTDRKEGLLDLNIFLQLGPRSLNQFELKRITELFNKMLMDPHVKNYSLLFKVLNNLITSHKSHIYDWLYLLLTRLILKMGSITLTSLATKITATLDTIFISFPVDNQFNCLTRFLADQSQTLNEKSKLCLLNYTNRLISKMVPVDCYSPDKHELQLSLMKLITWTSDPKSAELRRQSKEALIGLFTVNRQRIYTILYQLPKTYQDAAFTLIHSRKRLSDDKSSFVSSAVLAPSASLLQDSSMFMSLNIRNGSTCPESGPFDENLNPDEIYSSLLKTTDEIQKYKFNGLTDDEDNSDLSRLSSSLIIERKPASTLSSPLTASSLKTQSLSRSNPVTPKNGLKSKSNQTNGHQVDLNDRKVNGLTSNFNGSGHLSEIKPIKISSSSYSHGTMTTMTSTYVNGSFERSYSQVSNSYSNGHGSIKGRNGHETVTNNLISSLKNGHNKDNDYQKYALNELIELIKDSQVDLSRHFRDMLKILLDKMADETNPTVRQLALRILRELLLKQPGLFSDYTELTVLRILSSSKDSDKEVQRISDLVAATAACVLPAESCLKILKSAMNSGDAAISQAAIKMLSKFIERQNEDVIESLLPDIMPSLTQACDNMESSIRKSAIFTLVAIHNRIGDRLNPYLTGLNGSKMKLLKLYIERAQGVGGSNGSEFSFSSLNYIN